jgi:hypothetical protein
MVRQGPDSEPPVRAERRRRETASSHRDDDPEGVRSTATNNPFFSVNKSGLCLATLRGRDNDIMLKEII